MTQNTDSPFEHLKHLLIISKKELRMLIPYSDQHILRMEKAGTFPARLDLGENRVGWYLVEVEAWIRSRRRRDYPNHGNPFAN